ncbi:hypothetical protein EJ08DRAFT_4093 [Tothia fuscella]|uniref:Uncharacterized protein n=1 Tax=Tothia fuscella TaxID=1048955 RepID=A0A9P4P225_9PEZI|nr:hypothetical protein EJ08DRAFT_4093 [Tothia fuscella]
MVRDSLGHDPPFRHPADIYTKNRRALRQAAMILAYSQASLTSKQVLCQLSWVSYSYSPTARPNLRQESSVHGKNRPARTGGKPPSRWILARSRSSGIFRGFTIGSCSRRTTVGQQNPAPFLLRNTRFRNILLLRMFSYRMQPLRLLPPLDHLQYQKSPVFRLLHV